MNTVKNQESRSWVIYALSDPRNPKAVRYVGVTHQVPKKRLDAHVSLARKGIHTHVSYWIQSLLRDGERPLLEIIDTGVGFGWDSSEVYWIKWYREHGFDLVNHTVGGEGSLGHPCSEETKAKLRASKKGKKLSAEHRAKISLGGMGRKPSTETRAKLSLSKMGNSPSPEARAKISAASSSREHSSETRKKISLANVGKKRSPETCVKLSDAIKESWGSRDRSASPETRANMSRAHKERWARIRGESEPDGVDATGVEVSNG